MNKIKVIGPLFSFNLRGEIAAARYFADPHPDIYEYNKQPEAVSERNKILLKTYVVDGNDKLILNNQYGNINVLTTSKNEIKVKVEIKAFESSDSRALDLLDNVVISESRQGNTIDLSTKISKANPLSALLRRAGSPDNKHGVQVNYTVYMPAKNALEITNRYGSINLPDFDGRVSIHSAYGSLTAQGLTNPENTIKVSYGSVDIKSLSSASLDLAYGNLSLGSADKLNAVIEYSPSGKIGRLSGSGSIHLKYSPGFKISSIDPKNLNIDADYSTISLQFAPQASFEYDVSVNYCDFTNKNRARVPGKTSGDEARGGLSKNYKGSVGRGSEGRVTVRSSYGPVQFL